MSGSQTAQPDPRVCVGVVVGAHGVRGGVRVKSFTLQPADIVAYGPLEDEAGSRRFRPRLLGKAPKGVVLLALDGIGDRNAAEALKGLRLWVPRSALPPPGEEEFYYSDLIGLAAECVDGTDLGVVKGVFDFGGGDVIEVRGPQGSKLLPFTRAVVPLVDLASRRLVIDPPVEIEARPEEEEAGDPAEFGPEDEVSEAEPEAEEDGSGDGDDA